MEAELSWKPNTESDLAGYRIYRNGLPLVKVDKTVTIYRDANIPADMLAVSYYVTAIDTSDNESAPSNVVTKVFLPPSKHKFTVKEAKNQVVVSWPPSAYAKVAAPRKTTKSLVTITITGT